MTVELPNGEVGGNADTSLECGQGNLGLLGKSLLGNRCRDVRRHSLQCLRINLCRIEHVLRSLHARESRKAGASTARGILLGERLFYSVEGETIVKWRTSVSLDGIRVGDPLQRRNVRDPRHGDQIAGGGVVAECQECERTTRPLAGSDECRKGRVRQTVELAGRHVPRPGEWLLTE